MEKQVGIWIDSKKAIIVTLNGQKEERITEIDSEVENSVYHNKEGNKGTFSGGHHSDSETKFDNRKKEELNYFLKSVLFYIIIQLLFFPIIKFRFAVTMMTS